MSTKLPFDYAAETTAYYNTHAAEFCEKTAALDMNELYAPFLHQIPIGGRILDAGCGSGRDSLAFLQKGYRVVSIDASAEMVKATTKLTGQQAKLLRFDGLDFDSEFDGIWACASLLHVARRDLNAVLDRLTKALLHDGVLYMSFKHGDKEAVEDGRLFNHLDEELLSTVLASHPQLELVRVWITEDVRGGGRRGHLQWLNAIARRDGPSNVQHGSWDAR